jgi:regulator of protease activity HflC (stomatin/prohibitin superfamily)
MIGAAVERAKQEHDHHVAKSLVLLVPLCGLHYRFSSKLSAQNSRAMEAVMKKLVVLFAVVACAGLLSIPIYSASVASSEAAAARVPLEAYIQGHATGNGDFMRKAFHTEAKVMAFRDGKLTNLTSEEFASRFNGKLAADEAQRKRRIENVEITGNAGVGKIVLDYPTVTYTDYMSLLKVGDEWKIVNKVFYAEPKAKQ